MLSCVYFALIAPHVSYISKDPNTPCSLTDALEHFQVENLEDLIPKEMENKILPPRNISYNITIVAVEGCHSFVILDWAKPKKGDFITGNCMNVLFLTVGCSKLTKSVIDCLFRSVEVKC